MTALTRRSIEKVYHYTPLHYLLFIGRSNALLCKPSLAAAGFPFRHLRSTSRGRDVERGFGRYTHLTLGHDAPILKAKLAVGFPHVGLAVPTSVIEAVAFDLCRFNVAMTRRLRRNGSPGFPESRTNGRYYDGLQIPVARTDEDKSAMLDEHLPKGTMIEVLVHGDLQLPDITEVVCYSDADAELAKDTLLKAGALWAVTASDPPGPYLRNAEHVRSIESYLDQALSAPAWRGNGLEFDRVMR
jgi:hypothetical protein